MRSRVTADILRRLFSVVVALLLVGLVAPRPAEAATLPSGFSDAKLADVGSPTAMAFTPDGRLLITTQHGQVRIYESGALRPTPALDLNASLCTNSERGLLGAAVDPDFLANRQIYFYRTFRKFGTCDRNSVSGPVNRVSRFTMNDDGSLDPSSELVLVDNIPSLAGNHNAGDLQFGADGLLYVSVGDSGCKVGDPTKCDNLNDNARAKSHLLGKILRVDPVDGSVPRSNPWAGLPGARRCGDPAGVPPGDGPCAETFAWGLRNPFRFAMKPGTSEFFVNDVGQEHWEEINEGSPGADYGWNVREGHCTRGSYTNCGPPPGGMVNPIHDYSHVEAGCASITGGAFVPPGVWPTAYDGSYLFGDYVCGKIFQLKPTVGGGYERTEFVGGLGGSSAVAMVFGPHESTQALYYTTYAGGGQLRRIKFEGGGNRPPSAVLTAAPSSGPAPLMVTLDGTGSSDPDPGDSLTYLWDFGDGEIVAASTARVQHTYAGAGTYHASLRVRDEDGASSDPASARIVVGNSPPAPSITTPDSSTRFGVGQEITLLGGAIDPDDGTLPDSALLWEVIRHHGSHTHPYVPPTAGNGVTFTAPPPEDLAATTNSFLEIRLTATDSQGLSETVTQQFHPRLVDVTLDTDPAGLRLEVNGTSVSGPTTITSWEGYALHVNAPNQADASGNSQHWVSWSDGGAANHMITTPASAARYTASFAGREHGHGLSAEYFDNSDLTGPSVSRIDGTVAFDWGTGSPVPGIMPNDFSVRWTGQLEPRVTGPHTFITTSDDGVRLWVDGRPIIDNWRDHSATQDTGTIQLVAGQRYAITMEYYEGDTDAVARLEWSGPGQAREVIPPSQLFPVHAVNFQPASAPVPHGYVSDAGAVYGDRGNGLRYGWDLSSRTQTRDRNAPDSPDQRYDTLIHLQKRTDPTPFWELQVANGVYKIHLVAGDPDHIDSVYKIAVEGTVTVNGVPTRAAPWVEGTATVTVTDGKLTITNAKGAKNNKLCFVDVERIA